MSIEKESGREEIGTRARWGQRGVDEQWTWPEVGQGKQTFLVLNEHLCSKRDLSSMTNLTSKLVKLMINLLIYQTTVTHIYL